MRPLNTLSRARGAFLGLALGDAYGRPLAPLRNPEVRTFPVDIRPGVFNWTDDTHMALYLARAVLDLPGGALDGDAFGHRVGSRLVEWLHDPLQPATDPDGATARAARRYQESGSWSEAGDPGADGLGALSRVCPLALAFSSDDLTASARIVARFSHGHPSTVEAAVAAAHLLRWAIEGGRFDAGLVQAAIQALHGPWNCGGDTLRSLQSALELSCRRAQRLDEDAIYPGDGGRGAAGALGLAVAAALIWGDHVEKAVDRAARIEGSSDTVAALAGMFLGGAHGEERLPASWRGALHAREEIASLAATLARRAEGGGPRPRVVGGSDTARTSTSHPLEAVRLPADLPGSIYLCPAPGQKAPSAFGAPWDRDLDQDLNRLLAIYRVELLVCLLDEYELQRLRIADLASEAAARRLVALSVPVAEGGAPDPRILRGLVATILAFARAGRGVALVSRAGRDRAGLVGAACLLPLGRAPAEALAAVRALLGPEAVSRPDQALSEFAKELAQGTSPL